MGCAAAKIADTYERPAPSTNADPGITRASAISHIYSGQGLASAEMRAELNISWQSKLNEANVSLQELQEKLKAQEEIISDQRGKIWDRDGRLEDAAETLKATTEKLQNRIELLEHLVDGRNADIEVRMCFLYEVNK